MPIPKKLPYDLFHETFKYVPRVALNLLITNSSNEFLLTKRTIPPRVDFWHFPGSFLLKHEHLDACLKRIAEGELNFKIDTDKCIMQGVFENLTKDPRGHVLDILYTYHQDEQQIFAPTKESKEILFFSKIPKKMAFNHNQVLKSLGY
jgi:ADP-ribose pyrophosphatase YjhB (NUDIX family)